MRSALLPKMHLMRNSEDERLFQIKNNVASCFSGICFDFPEVGPAIKTASNEKFIRLKGFIQIKNIVASHFPMLGSSHTLLFNASHLNPRLHQLIKACKNKTVTVCWLT